jgi:hypothetical protein
MASDKKQPSTSLVLGFQKATKGTFVYQNVDAGIPGLYLPKAMDVFQGNEDPPNQIELTIKVKQ